MENWQLEIQTDGSWTVDGLYIPPCNALTALLYAFREHHHPKVREEAFWQIADILWNRGGKNLFERHKWADLTVRTCITEKYCAFGGSAGSGKSYTLAGFAIVEWLCAPADTIVLLTSTTLTAARTRIWGCIEKLLDAAEGLPVNVRSSIGSAAYVNPSGTVVETAGFRLIAAEKNQSRDAVGKLIGFHAPRVILIADELSELSEAILQAGLSNLAQTPYFRLRAASNPNSRFDPFGVWSEPKRGWDAIDVFNDRSWRTKYDGLFVRYDAEDSPNLEHDPADPPYPYLPTRKGIDDAKEHLGEKSRNFNRMFRAVFAANDEEDAIYSEAELQRSGALQRTEMTNVTPVAGLDPSFSSGGDDTVLMFGEVGYDPAGQFCIQPTEFLRLRDDATDKSTPRTFQIAEQVKAACIKRGVDPYNLAVDATGAGGPFCDVLASLWSPDFLRVQFGGTASDRPVSASKRTPACELFTNRVTELWFGGKELIRCRQIHGIPNEVAMEMCLRAYDMVKATTGLRMRAESKNTFRVRNGRSPDHADAFFVMLELARQRHSLVAVEPVKDDDGMSALRRHRTHKHLDVANLSHHAWLE